MTKTKFVALFVAWNAFLQFCYFVKYDASGNSFFGISSVVYATEIVWETFSLLTLPSGLQSIIRAWLSSVGLSGDFISAVAILLLSWPVGAFVHAQAKRYGWTSTVFVFCGVSAVVTLISTFLVMRVL